MLDNLGQNLVTLFVLAVIAEMVTQLIKGWFEKEKELPKQAKRYIAIAVALAVGVYYTWQTGTSILQTLGYEVQNPTADVVMTGVFISGGSRMLYKLYTLATGWLKILAEKNKN